MPAHGLAKNEARGQTGTDVMTRFCHLRSRRRAIAAAFGTALSALLLGAAAFSTPSTPVTDPDDAAEKQYFTATLNDPIARLQKRIDAGEINLAYAPRRGGYLPAVLKALKIPVDSQTLVFSKTSLQIQDISPRSPRALYFNDDCYVGWVWGGGTLEISAVDPVQGAVFYTLYQKPIGRPRFVRQTFSCLQCHQTTMTQGVPGHIVRSVYPRPDGRPDFASGSHLTTDESPMVERWGGWYVSGTHGKRQRHSGNVMARGADGEAHLDRDAGANITDLSRFFETQAYQTPHSDIVALLVLEHQTNLHNLFTRAGYAVRDALRDARVMNRAEGKQEDAPRSSTESRIQSACEPVVRALLFANAAPLEEPVKGTSGFTQRFPAAGPRDSKGRSLRDLDLKTRLLRYPCSYLIYSEAFDALPALAKTYIYSRLRAVLVDGIDTAPGSPYASLTPADRQAIYEILAATKPGFPLK